jgi:hypothetical protein
MDFFERVVEDDDDIGETFDLDIDDLSESLMAETKDIGQKDLKHVGERRQPSAHDFERQAASGTFDSFPGTGMPSSMPQMVSSVSSKLLVSS